MLSKTHPQKGFANMIVLIIFLLTIGGTVVYFKNFPMEKLSAGQSTEQPQAVETQKQTQSIKTQLPPVNTASKMEQLVWSVPVKKEYRDYFGSAGTKPIKKILNGYEIVATPATYTEELRKVWGNEKFKQMGWEEDLSTEADGVQSSIWGYFKGDLHLIFNQMTTPPECFSAPGEPKSSVPCTYTISVFSDDINILNTIKNAPSNKTPKN